MSRGRARCRPRSGSLLAGTEAVPRHFGTEAVLVPRHRTVPRYAWQEEENKLHVFHHLKFLVMHSLSCLSRSDAIAKVL